MQPQWSELLKALAGLSDELTIELATTESSLAVYRLEDREVAAFRRTVGSEPANVGLEQFVLAAAALRHCICQNVDEWRGLQSTTPGAMPEALVHKCRETVRMADAYVKHFTHLIDQAVFDEQLAEARQFLRLRTRLLRKSAGLVLLIPRRSGPVHEREVAAIPVHEPAPFGTLSED